MNLKPVNFLCFLVQCIQPESGFWTQHSQTEVVHSSSDPVFKKTIKFYATDLVDFSTKLRLVLYSAKKSNLEIVSCLTNLLYRFSYDVQTNT